MIINIFRILFYSIACLAFGSYRPERGPLFFISFVAMFTIFFVYLLVRYRGDYKYEFFLVYFILEQFNFWPEIGGLWNYVIFFPLAVHVFLGKMKIDAIKTIPFKIFILWNCLGWFFVNGSSQSEILNGAISFFGSLLVFCFISGLSLSAIKIKSFIYVSALCVIYLFLVCLNQKWSVINMGWPVLGNIYYSTGVNSIGMPLSMGLLAHSELTAEYGMLMTIFFTILAFSENFLKELKINKYVLYISIFLAVGISVTAWSRSAAILICAFFIGYGVHMIIFKHSRILLVGKYLFVIAVFIGGIFLLSGVINLESLVNRFKDEKVEIWNAKDVLSGKSIHRGAVFDIGVKRLRERPWIVGYGYGSPISNHNAWFGEETEIYVSDYHNLYLSLPMIFGWVGAIAFLLIVFFNLCRLYKFFISVQHKQSIYAPLAIAFFWMFIFFLINQYKISMLRTPSYYGLFWVWMGLCNAVIRNGEKME